jgi:hypothetical protein
MSYARQMLDTYPRALDVDAGMLAAAIDAMTDCAQACIADTDADLGEQNVTEMIRCIRLCLNCADVCTTTAGVTSRPAGYDADVTEPLLEPAWRSARAAATSGGLSNNGTASGDSELKTAGLPPLAVRISKSVGGHQGSARWRPPRWQWWLSQRVSRLPVRPAESLLPNDSGART